MNGSRNCYVSVQRLLRHFSSGTQPPIRVGLTENTGRGVFAIREIRTGDLIHTEDPFVAHPYLSTVDKVCYYCLRRLKSFANSHWEKAKSPANTLQDGQNEVHFCSNQCTEKAKDFYEIEKEANWSLYHEQCR
ncbi:histone-lysine N-methyltransferase ATXR4 [Cryptomeria japonica]|uniref:histone-lysine N-methyltransferase ATXR4 n=1 Tax=Cryptomeria japonica TaxID=3369 RepID=UPI0027DAA10A|nr:histone-lysine N-methyltransferase ATXR4 [Cryptomeria japonica]